MTATATGEAATFLRILHGRHNDSIELRVKNGSGNFHSEFFPAGELERAAARAEGLSPTHDVYCGVGARDGKGGTRENMTNLSAVFVDVDLKDGVTRETMRDRIKGLPRPSMIVNSGGGWHLYWILKEAAGPEDFERIRNINSALAAILGGDQGATDPARILRVPGTLNRKKEYGTPRPVQLLEVNGAEYLLSDFDLYLPVEGSQERKKAAPIPEVIREREGIGRHNTLASLAGSMRNRGATAAEILPALVAMNQRCSPRVSDKDLEHIAESMERYPAGEVFKGKEREAASAPPPAKVDPRVLVIETMNTRTAADLLLDTKPEPPRAIEGLLYLENLLTIAGPPKAGKSWLAVLLMLCLISGRPFLGHLIPRKYKVLYMYGEGGEYPFKQRLQRAIAYFDGLSDDDMERLHLLWTAGRVKLDDPRVEDALLRWSADADIIVVDPLYKHVGRGDENSHSDARVLQDVFSRLQCAGKTVVLVHHTRKAGQSDAGVDEVRGAGLAAASDAILRLDKKKHGINTKYTLRFDLKHFPEPDPMELARHGGLFEVADVGRPIATVADLVTVIQEAGGEVLGRDTLREAVERHTGNTVSVETIKRVIQSAESIGAVKAFPNPGRGGKTRYVA